MAHCRRAITVSFSVIFAAGVGVAIPRAAPAIQATTIPHDVGSLTIHSGKSTIDVRIGNGSFAVSQPQMLDWVKSGARGISNYLGAFPVAHVTIVISSIGNGDGIGGTTYGGRLIRMRLGSKVIDKDLADDWTLTHEMFHLAFPDMGDDHKWMNEGLSVYLEPVARARIGIVTPNRYWRELVEGLKIGQPGAGDKGLDHTHTWARTYWGGTAFWFLVDLEIRQQTHGKKSIDDVIKTILAAGGDGSQSWSMQQVLDMGDKATGTHVMHDVYSELAPQPKTIDFGPWWRQLGVRYAHGDVTFDDRAPLAWMRKSIIAPDGKGRP